MSSTAPPAATRAENEEDALAERLKSSLWYHLGHLLDSLTLKHNINATPQFIGALTEMVWSQIESSAVDVEAFARHRTGESREGEGLTVKAGDVRMLGRRNEDLERLLASHGAGKG